MSFRAGLMGVAYVCGPPTDQDGYDSNLFVPPWYGPPDGLKSPDLFVPPSCGRLDGLVPPHMFPLDGQRLRWTKDPFLPSNYDNSQKMK